MQKFLMLLVVPLFCGCNARREPAWVAIRTSDIPASTLVVWNDPHGGSVEGEKGVSDDQLVEIIRRKKEGRPVKLLLKKNSELDEEGLKRLAGRIRKDLDRRVFSHRARGSVDSVETSHEWIE